MLRFQAVLKAMSIFRKPSAGITKSVIWYKKYPLFEPGPTIPIYANTRRIRVPNSGFEKQSLTYFLLMNFMTQDHQIE
jgi:hypothetical protein